MEAFRFASPASESEVEMLTGAQAIRILGVASLTLGQLVADSQVDSVQTVSGNIWGL